jgi:tRNA(Ile)-lysidine synthase
MKPVLDLVRQAVREHDLARPDTRVVVALSGGSDSVALAHLVRELAEAGELRAAGAAHFNHELRATADRDERFCAGVADAMGWPLVTGREDVAARARREHRSIEDAARTARHHFFERTRAALAADVVALGHTLDDQAETFLLRLLRGAGPRGLAAMYPRIGSVIRPLLGCRRAALRAYLDERRIAYVEDESNRDVAIPRNRVRAELLPLLQARFNPGVVEVLAEEAEMARDEWAWMLLGADQVCARIRRVAPDRERAWDIDVSGLREAPRALQRLILWRAMTDAAGGRHVGFKHVRAALGLLQGDGSAGIDAPGQRVQRMGARLVLTGRPAGAVGRPAQEPAHRFCYPLPIPGEVRLFDAGCVVSAEIGPPGQSGVPGPPAAGESVAVVCSEICAAPLAVRNRRPGDRFRPLGLDGHKKLQDFFVDRKVERHRRDLVPLVVDARNRIVWVAGHAMDAEFRVTDPTKAVLILRLKHLGGPA